MRVTLIQTIRIVIASIQTLKAPFMKTTCIIVSMLTILGLATGARADSSWFIQGGVDGAKFNQDYRTNKYGLLAGVGGHIGKPLSERLLLGGQLELSYVQRGTKAVVNDVLQSNIRLHYLDATLLARPTVRFDQVGAYALLGAGICVLMSANDKNENGMSQDIIDSLHRIDASLVMGAGMMFRPVAKSQGPLRIDSFFVEARYELGLVDVDTADLGFKNRTLALLLGVAFALSSSDEGRPLDSKQKQ